MTQETNSIHEATVEEDRFDREQENSGRFKDGDPIRFVRVRFPGNARSFPFMTGKRDFMYGQKVVAMSDRGMTVGYINSFTYEAPFDKSMLPIRSIAKVATEEDIQQQKDNIRREKEAERVFLDLVEQFRLEMTLTHVEFIQFGKKAVFYFNAPSRVDFREMVKELVGNLKMRIELRQISVRDRTAALGGIGVCGLQTCCSSFLSTYGQVNIKMAKNQNLALIPSKLNGVCGQIKCCIKYEDEVYSEKRKRLPKQNALVKLLNGECGKVLRLHVLEEQFDMLSDRGVIRRYEAGLYDFKNGRPDNQWSFPERFDHIINEVSVLVKTSSLPQETPPAEIVPPIAVTPAAATDEPESLEADLDDAQEVEEAPARAKSQENSQGGEEEGPKGHHQKKGGRRRHRHPRHRRGNNNNKKNNS